MVAVADILPPGLVQRPYSQWHRPIRAAYACIFELRTQAEVPRTPTTSMVRLITLLAARSCCRNDHTTFVVPRGPGRPSR
jgi:hypothetical protein